MKKTPVPEGDGRFERIYAVVRRIPKGRVATYGQVAVLAGLPRRARLVGYALGELGEGSKVPWHRVVNASGGISFRPSPCLGLQRVLLEREGVAFAPDGTVSLSRFRWQARGVPGF